MLRCNTTPNPQYLGPGSAKKKSVGHNFDVKACPPPPDIQCWGATPGANEQRERTFFSQRREHPGGNQHWMLGGRGVRIFDLVFYMTDFFFADPGMRLHGVLFGFLRELVCLILRCSWYVLDVGGKVGADP